MTATHTPPVPVSSPPGNPVGDLADEYFTALFLTALFNRAPEDAITELSTRLEAMEAALQRGRDLRAQMLARRWHAGRTLETLAALVGLSSSRVDQLVKRGCQIASLPGKRRKAQ